MFWFLSRLFGEDVVCNICPYLLGTLSSFKPSASWKRATKSLSLSIGICISTYLSKHTFTCIFDLSSYVEQRCVSFHVSSLKLFWVGFGMCHLSWSWDPRIIFLLHIEHHSTADLGKLILLLRLCSFIVVISSDKTLDFFFFFCRVRGWGRGGDG